jgi:hypothetical protein
MNLDIKGEKRDRIRYMVKESFWMESDVGDDNAKEYADVAEDNIS